MDMNSIRLSATTWKVQSMHTNIVSSDTSQAMLYFTGDNTLSDLRFKVSIQQTQIGCIIVRNIPSCRISQCQISKQDHSHATAITALQSSLYVYGSVVLGNNVSPVVGILNAIDNSEVVIEKSNFTQNICPKGMISVSKSSHLSISNSHFAENLGSHKISGGIVTISENSSALIENSTFTENNGVIGPGVMALYHSKIQITKCTFTKNIGCAGGAIGVGYKSSLFVKESILTENSATLDTSIRSKDEIVKDELRILVSSTDTHTFYADNKEGLLPKAHDVHSSKTTADPLPLFTYAKLGVVQCNGAAIFSHQSKVVAENSTFENNSVRDVGGAIYIQNSSHISIRNCTLHANSAESAGGAVFVNQDCYTSVDSSSFVNNHAP